MPFLCMLTLHATLLTPVSLLKYTQDVVTVAKPWPLPHTCHGAPTIYSGLSASVQDSGWELALQTVQSYTLVCVCVLLGIKPRGLVNTR
jgi:hypothetical protein